MWMSLTKSGSSLQSSGQNWKLTMSLFHCFSSIVIAFLLVTFQGQSSQAQTVDSQSLAERIRHTSGSVLVLNDLVVVRSDLVRLFNDAGFGFLVSSMDEYFPLEEESGISFESGALYYFDTSLFTPGIVNIVVSNRDSVLKALNAPAGAEIDDLTWFHSGSQATVPFRGILDSFTRSPYGLLNENQLWLSSDKSRPEVEKLLDAPPLSRTLDETATRIINQSGLTLIGINDEDSLAKSFDLEPMLKEYKDQLTEAELEWLREFSGVVVSAEFGLLGLKYHQSRFLELQALARIRKDASFDSLINLDNLDRLWRPSLGLETEQLVIAGGIQMDAFRSSAGPRTIPRLLLGEFGKNDALRFLQGNMLKVLLELGGDSWNELTAARLALYQNEESDKVGKLAIIGVVDTLDVDDVMTELRLLSTISNPMMAAERTDQRTEEIQRLVQDLNHDDPNTSSRAETRLRLVGPQAIDALEKALKKADQRLQRRIDRVLSSLQRTQDKVADRSAVADPWFWTTLNPGLEFFEAKGNTAGFVTHVIEITPDPSKTEKEADDAIQVMAQLFGSQWNQIRIVQVKNHFVFMLGSDNERLERIVSNVEQGIGAPAQQFEGIGFGPQKGQLQFFFDTKRLSKILNLRTFFSGKQSDEDEICWMGLDFDSRSISASALIPVDQITQFLSGLGG